MEANSLTQNLVVVGRPGSQKSEFARLIAQEMGLAFVSTGAELRRCARGSGPLGTSVRAAVDSGSLVPTAIVQGLLVGSIRSPRRGLVLAGYPRTSSQWAALTQVLDRSAPPLVLHLDVPPTMVLSRVARRLFCDGCDRSFPVRDATPLCLVCGALLRRRADDEPEVLLRRLWDYERETMPLIDWLAHRQTVVLIDGTMPIDQAVRQAVDVAFQVAA